MWQQLQEHQKCTWCERSWQPFTLRLTVGCHEYKARTLPTRMSLCLVLMLSVSSLSPLFAATRCSLHPNSLLVWHWLSYISPARSHPPLPPLFLSSLYVFALPSLTSLFARCVSVLSRTCSVPKRSADSGVLECVLSSPAEKNFCSCFL